MKKAIHITLIFAFISAYSYFWPFSEISTFHTNILKLSFEYPSKWGYPRIIEQKAALDAKTKSYQLTFSSAVLLVADDPSVDNIYYGPYWGHDGESITSAEAVQSYCKNVKIESDDESCTLFKNTNAIEMVKRRYDPWRGHAELSRLSDQYFFYNPLSGLSIAVSSNFSNEKDRKIADAEVERMVQSISFVPFNIEHPIKKFVQVFNMVVPKEKLLPVGELAELKPPALTKVFSTNDDTDSELHSTDAEWNTYVNKKYLFSLKTPKFVGGGKKNCLNYFVPFKIFETKDGVSLGEEYGLDKDCHKVSGGGIYIMFSFLADEKDLKAFLRNRYDLRCDLGERRDSGYTVAYFIVAGTESSSDAVFGCDGDILYNLQSKTAVIMPNLKTGGGVHLFRAPQMINNAEYLGDPSFDIYDSFEFLTQEQKL